MAVQENKTVLTTDNWKEKLLRNYKSLVHDIDLVGTLDGLFSEDVFTAEERELVENAAPNTTHNKNRQLLKILLQKTDAKFQIFLNCIEEIGHTQMVEQIHSTDISKLPVHSDQSTKNTEIINLRRRIFRKYDEIVEATSLVDLVDDFITDRIFEIRDWEIITNAVPSTTDERNREFLDILLRKDYGYKLFIDLLVQQGHSVLVSKIQESVVDDKVENEIDRHLRNKDKDPLPQNIREQFQSILEKWKVEDLVFYDTRAAKSVIEAINKGPAVTVIGNGGTGKSAIIHHVALELHKKGYDILPVSGPKEIHKYLQKMKRQVFVIDDPIGVHGIDKDKFKKWIDHENKLEPSIAHGNTKILCSIRKQVSNESDFKRGKCFLNKKLIDIQDDENKLSDEEKLCMINQHLTIKKSDLKITPEAEIILKSTQELFPLICKLFSSSEEFQRLSWNFFKNPFSLVLEDLENMQHTDRIKYCVLALCFAYENSLDPNIFSTFNTETRQKSEPYIIACRVTVDTLISSFTEASSSLLGVYLQEERGVYKFSHDLIYDVVAFQFGSHHPEMVLKLGSSKFIRDRVAVSKDTVQTEDPYILILTPEYYTDLANRLLDDLENGIFNYVLMNKCWDDDGFMIAFEDIFYKKRTNLIRKLVQGKFERRQSILNMFIKCSDRYKDEIKQEVKEIENMDYVQLWSWYYTAMDFLNTPGVTALHWVVAFAHKTLFNLLWKKLSSGEKQQIMKKVPLIHTACLGGDTEICEVLLKVENDKINSSVTDIGVGLTDQFPLHLAVGTNADVVELLIKNGALVNAKRSGESPIFCAAALGNLESVKVLIKHGADINMCNNNGFSPLYMATQLQRNHIVELLLEHNAHIDVSETADGWSPLLIAVDNDDTKLTKLLLENKADINLCNKTGTTPLLEAVNNDRIELAKLLLDHNANVDVQDTDGHTPLTSAIENNNTEMLKLLLDNKADINLCNKTGHTPLKEAVYNDKTELAKFLLDHNAMVNIQDSNGFTALIMAVQNNNVAMVELLLDKKADINLCNNFENTPLMAAVYNDRIELAKLLLDHNANVDVQDTDGHTPLTSAIENNNTEMLKLLLDNKADINLCDKTGQTPLKEAVYNDKTELAKFLLDHHANVDIQDSDGFTALIMAVQNNNVAMVELLLDKKADINLCNNFEITPLMAAVYNDRIELAKLLLDHNANVDIQDIDGFTAFIMAVQNNNVAMVKLLLDKKADINLCNKLKNTPLNAAVYNDRIEFAKLLLDHGANVDVHDIDGYTPLISAIENNNIEMVNLLLHQNANVNLCGKDGNMLSPLQCAVKGNKTVITKLLLEHGASVDFHESEHGLNSLMLASSNNNNEIVELLLNHNASIDQCNNDGDTALMMASSENFTEIVQLLLEHQGDINIKNKCGETALIQAQTRNATDVINLLQHH